VVEKLFSLAVLVLAVVGGHTVWQFVEQHGWNALFILVTSSLRSQSAQLQPVIAVDPPAALSVLDTVKQALFW